MGTTAAEAALVEQWLDAHPDFVHNYVMRCPMPAVLEYLLGSRDVPASTTLGQSIVSVDAATTAATGSSASRASSGANTPVRKISANQFEKRGQTLSRMVTTVHGVPSFLASSSDAADGSRASLCRRSSRDLKSRDICELMYELILDICNDLDVTSLTHKILQDVCLLVDADHCSLFHVERRRSWTPAYGDDDRCLVSKLFNVSAHSTVSECNAEEIRVVWGSGIVGHVAVTGNTVNVPDAYEVGLTVHVRLHFIRSSLKCLTELHSTRNNNNYTFVKRLNVYCKIGLLTDIISVCCEMKGTQLFRVPFSDKRSFIVINVDTGLPSFFSLTKCTKIHRFSIKFV